MKKINFEQKHLLAVDTEDYLQTQLMELKNKIDSDETGSCWHIEKTFEKTCAMAQVLDKMTKDEKLKMPLYGLSVGMKDLFCIKGLQTTAGSEILNSFISPYDSTVWKSIEEKGVLLAAKCAMDEFAMGSFSNTSYLGRVSVPGYPEHSAGGSSGGSGAGVASGIFDFSVGSDTGGSVRLPASFCSTVGYKPSYGAFSRYGMIAYASSLDQAGFLTQEVEDVIYLLKAQISHKDPKDMTCRGLALDYQESSLQSKSIGFFPQFLDSPDIEKDIKLAYENLLSGLKHIGVKLVPIEVPYMDKAAHIYYTIACSEACSNLAKYQGVFFGKKLIDEKFNGSYWEQCAQYRSKYFGKEVQKRIMLGSFILSSENYSSMYQKAISLRKVLKQEFKKIFQDLDALVLPTSPMTSPKWQDIDKMTTSQIYLSDFMTVPFSLAGLPAVSVPWYKNKQGMAIGIQWVGAEYKDMQLLKDIFEIEKTLSIKH